MATIMVVEGAAMVVVVVMPSVRVERGDDQRRIDRGAFIVGGLTS